MTLSVPLDAEVEEQLHRLARAKATTKTALAAEAIRLYVESETWQIEEIKRGIEEADSGDFASDREVHETLAKWLRR